MQEAVWSTFSVVTKRLELGVPVIDPTRINVFHDDAYLQCLDFRAVPYARLKNKKRKKSESELEDDRKRRANTETNEVEKSPYNIEVKCFTTTAQGPGNEPGSRMMGSFNMPKHVLSLVQFIEEFNSQARDSTGDEYNSPPLFLDWIPRKAASDSLSDINSWFEVILHDFQLSDTYEEKELPPNANKYKLDPTTDLSTIRLRLLIAPSTRVTWQTTRALGHMGFNVSKDNVTFIKPMGNEKFRWDYTNKDTRHYKMVLAQVSPSSNALPKNLTNSVAVHLNCNIDRAFDVNVQPNRLYRDFDSMLQLVQESMREVSLQTNIKFVVKPQVSARYYRFLFNFSNRLQYSVTFSNSLVQLLLLDDVGATNLSPMIRTELLVKKPSQSKPQEPSTTPGAAAANPTAASPPNQSAGSGNDPPTTAPPAAAAAANPTAASPPNQSAGSGNNKEEDDDDGDDGDDGDDDDGDADPDKDSIRPFLLKAPTTLNDDVALIVNTIGSLYGCLTEIAQHHFPGKILFILKPGRFGWELFDSPFLTSPFLVKKRDLDKVNTNPLSVGLYFYNADGEMQLLDMTLLCEGLFLFKAD